MCKLYCCTGTWFVCITKYVKIVNLKLIVYNNDKVTIEMYYMYMSIIQNRPVVPTIGHRFLIMELYMKLYHCKEYVIVCNTTLLTCWTKCEKRLYMCAVLFTDESQNHLSFYGIVIKHPTSSNDRILSFILSLTGALRGVISVLDRSINLSICGGAGMSDCITCATCIPPSCRIFQEPGLNLKSKCYLKVDLTWDEYISI